MTYSIVRTKAAFTVDGTTGVVSTIMDTFNDVVGRAETVCLHRVHPSQVPPPLNVLHRTDSSYLHYVHHHMYAYL